jgi:hypothetical protein
VAELVLPVTDRQPVDAAAPAGELTWRT